MPSLTALCSGRVELCVPFGAEMLTLGYDPAVFTCAFMEELEAGMSLPACLSALVTDWDLLDERGEPLPLTEAALRELPVAVLREISRAVMDDFFPNPGTVAHSASTL